MKLEEISDLAGVKFPKRASFRVTEETDQMIKDLKRLHKKDPADFCRKAIERALRDIYGKTG